MDATTTTTQLEPALLAGTWQIDPSHSSVEFSVRHLMVSKVTGRVSRFGGEIHVDEVPHRSYVVATIDAASIDTGDERRDEHLRSPEFLDVAHHPTIQFRSTSIVPTGERWHVEGELTIRGVTRGVVLDVEDHGTGRDLWGATRAGLTATATINRKDFGLTWDAVLEGGGVVVGDKVEVTLEIQAAKQ
ncbi:MAG: YceI family protein [Actinomycetota bacterium]|nr:YceI family protein [Actinomycetota bacterium]